MLILVWAGFIVLLDQLSKLVVYKSFLPGQSLPIIKSVFHITLVLNTGAAFGFFLGKASFFVAVSFIVICAILTVILKVSCKGKEGYTKFQIRKSSTDRKFATAPVERLALAFILGGAISNLIDRLRFGYVIDFLDFRIWPVFNVADSAITIGSFFLVFNIIFSKRK